MTMRRDDGQLSQLIGTGGIAIVIIGWLYMVFSGVPKLPISTANGTYRNSCCGAVSLHDGIMTLNGQKRVRYIVEKDKGGAYVLPISYVGIRQGHELQIEADGKYPLILRLNDLESPTGIELTDLKSRQVYTFVK
jgi:hypothetical protein